MQNQCVDQDGPKDCPTAALWNLESACAAAAAAKGIRCKSGTENTDRESTGWLAATPWQQLLKLQSVQYRLLTNLSSLSKVNARCFCITPGSARPATSVRPPRRTGRRPYWSREPPAVAAETFVAALAMIDTQGIYCSSSCETKRSRRIGRNSWLIINVEHQPSNLASLPTISSHHAAVRFCSVAHWCKERV